MSVRIPFELSVIGSYISLC